MPGAYNMDLKIASNTTSLDLDYHNYPPHIFEHSYVTGVLGIKLPLNEAAPYSRHYRRLIIEEHLLFEGFFDAFKELAGTAKTIGLTLRYIMEDPKRIVDFVKSVLGVVKEEFQKFMDWCETVLEFAKATVKEWKMAEKVTKMVEAVQKAIKALWEKASSSEGWKTVLVGMSAAVAVKYIWDELSDLGGDAIANANDSKFAQILNKKEESFLYTAPTLASVLYSDDNRLDEFLGMGKKKDKKDDDSGDDDKSSGSKMEWLKKLPKEMQKIGKQIVITVVEFLQQKGKDFVSGIAIDAVLGAVSGGVSSFISWAGKIFGGMEFVMGVIGEPMKRFVSKVKGDKEAEKEAEKGIDDPTEGDSDKKKDDDKKNEAYVRELVRHIITEQAEALPEEQVLPQDEWVLLQPGDPRRELVKDDLYDMVQATYADIGGHFKIQSAGDLERYNYWVVKDIDDEPDADVAIMGKPDIGGVKMGAAANDGTAAAAAEYKNKSTELRRGGSVDGVGNWWGEVSGKPAYAMIKRGAPAVEDEATARRLMAGDDFEWHGEYPDPEGNAMFKSVKGWYTKKFGNHESTKIILGSPS